MFKLKGGSTLSCTQMGSFGCSNTPLLAAGFFIDVIPKNYNKAKSIYEKALTVNKLDDRNEVIDRLKELEKMKNNES